MQYRCGWCDGHYPAAEFYWTKKGDRIARCKTCVKTIAAEKKAERNKGRSCKLCDQPIPPNRSAKAKFCSNACNGMWHDRRMDKRVAKQCEMCGGVFLAASGRVSDWRFCSPACGVQWTSDDKKAKRLQRVMAMDRKCEHCGTPVPVGRRANTRRCSAKCSHASNSHARQHALRAEEVGPGYRQISRAYLGERDGWRCGICAGRLDASLKWPHPMSITVDHIVPVSVRKEGANDLANLQLAHCRCNTSKGNRPANDQLRLIG